MENLFSLPEKVYSHSSPLIVSVILFDSQGQLLKKAGSSNTNWQKIGEGAIYLQSNLKKEFSWHDCQTWLKFSEGTVVLIKIPSFFLLLLSQSSDRSSIGRLRNIVNSLEKFLKRISENSVKSLPANSPKSLELFLTRCERELSISIHNKVAKILIKKYYFLATQNRDKFVQHLAQKIKDPVAKKSFLTTLQPFCAFPKS
jgi:hypothetical protein